MAIMKDLTGGFLIPNLVIKYLRKHPEVFENFLGPFELKAKSLGLIRSQNTIRSMQADLENEVIDGLNDLLYERFIEWELETKDAI